MFSLIQIIRNSFIRLEGFFTVVWKSLANFVKNCWKFLARVFGFSQSNYFLASDEAQTIKQASFKQPTATVEDSTPTTSATTARRRPNSKVDEYYLNMVREVKKN
jgi:hypothetical protein